MLHNQNQSYDLSLHSERGDIDNVAISKISEVSHFSITTWISLTCDSPLISTKATLSPYPNLCECIVGNKCVLLLTFAIIVYVHGHELTVSDGVAT